MLHRIANEDTAHEIKSKEPNLYIYLQNVVPESCLFLLRSSTARSQDLNRRECHGDYSSELLPGLISEV